MYFQYIHIISIILFVIFIFTEIFFVSTDTAILGENGKVDPEKLQAITYDPVNHYYMVLGNKVGLAYRDGREMGE